MKKSEIVLDCLTGFGVFSLPFVGFWLYYIFQ